MPSRESKPESPAAGDAPASRARPLWLLLLVALLACLGWCSWPTEDLRPPAVDEPPSTPPAEVMEPVAAEAVLAAQRAPVGDAVPAPATYGVEADLTHRFAFELDVQLLDEFALPVADAMVFVAPPMCGFALWPERSDARGRVHLEWRGRLPAMEVDLAVIAAGVLQPLRLVRLQADLPRPLTIAVVARQQDPDLQERLRERDESELAHDAERVRRARERASSTFVTDQLDILCGRTQLLFREFDCTNCHDNSRVARYSTLARAGEMTPGMHPASRFRDLGGRAPSGEQLRDRRKALAENRLAAERQRTRKLDRGARVAGVVRRADGKRAADVPVVWRGSDGAVLQRTTTDKGGRYRLQQLGSGRIELVAAGGAEGTASTVVVTSRGQRTDWSCQLELASVVAGTVRDESGRPLVGWRVEFERTEGDWAGLATTDGDGGFRFTGVPGPGQCLLWPKGDDSSLPVAHGQSALVDARPIGLALDPNAPSRARVRVHVALPPGHERDRVDARLYQLESGRVASMPAFGFEDAFEVTGVSAGSYRVQLGAPGIGWVATGVVVIDGRGLWDLGALHLPAPVRVRIRTADGAPSPLDGPHAFYRRTPAVDVQVDHLKTDDGEVLLSPGEHVLLWRDAGILRSVAFHVPGAGAIDLFVGPR